MLCEYGCNKEANYVLKNGKHCCSKFSSQCSVVRTKNSHALKGRATAGLGHKFSNEDRRKSYELQLEKAIKNGFVEESTLCNAFLKKYMISYFHIEEKCSICGINSWNGFKLSLELDHINGINIDNRLENLRFLCPNCHSTTENFRGRNINNGKEKVSEEKFVEVLKKSKNIRRALLSLKLAAKGANYDKAKYLIDKYNITMGL